MNETHIAYVILWFYLLDQVVLVINLVGRVQGPRIRSVRQMESFLSGIRTCINLPAGFSNVRVRRLRTCQSAPKKGFFFHLYDLRSLLPVGLERYTLCHIQAVCCDNIML